MTVDLVAILFQADTGPQVPGAEPAELAAFLPGELSTSPVAVVADLRPEALMLTGSGRERRGAFASPGVGAEVTPVGPGVDLVVITDAPIIRSDRFVIFLVIRWMNCWRRCI
jgi:hypothetical protein